MHMHEAQMAAYSLHTRICKSKNQTWPPFVAVTDILEEAGEVADAVKNLRATRLIRSLSPRRSSPLSYPISSGPYSS